MARKGYFLRRFALDSFPEEKSPAEKASKKIELEVNPNSFFDSCNSLYDGVYILVYRETLLGSMIKFSA
mgnify:CR=1 FL=1